MPETRARDLANLAGAGATSSTVAYHETSRAFTLPAGTGSQNQVISSDGDGTTQWKNTLSAPVVTDATSTKGINRYESATDNGGGTFTVTGTDFGSTTSELTATISSDSSGVNNTVGDISCSSVSGTGGTTAVFTITGAESGFSNWTSSLSSSSIYVKVTKQGLASNIVALSGGVNTLSGDPTISSVTGTVSTTTVSTTSLGSYGGQIAGGGQDSNTKLLLNFDRIGGTDIEDSSNIGGDGHEITASGNATIKSSPFGDGKSAMFFDGSSDKLTIATPSGSGLHSTLGSNNNWFWEAWIYYLDAGSNQDRVIFSSRSASGVTALYIYVNEANDRLGLLCGGNSNWYVDAYLSGSMDTDFLNKWGHLLLQRNGNTLEAYVNGIKRTITGTSNDFSSSSTSLSVGTTMTLGDDDVGNYDFYGYLDEVRIGSGNPTSVSSDPLYISSGTSFSVPTSRYTAVSSDKLLIHSNQTDDSSSYNVRFDNSGYSIQKPETNNRGSGSSANFGNSAWYFDSAVGAANIRTQNSWLKNLGGGNTQSWTVEFWARFDEVPNPRYPFGPSDGTSSNNSDRTWSIGFTNSGTKIRFASSSSTSDDWDISEYFTLPNTIVANTWYHFAVVYDGSGTNASLKAFQNGSACTDDGNVSTTKSNYAIRTGSYDFAIGRHAGIQYKGYLDEIRISSTARYSSAFTPTTSAYSSDSNTRLLLHGDGAVFDDSSTSDHNITPTGAFHSQGHGGIAPALAFPASLKKTASAGMYFDGDTSHGGDRITVSPAPSHMTTQGPNTTIEFWFYCTGSGHRMTLFRTPIIDKAGQGCNFWFEIRDDGGLKGWLLEDQGYTYSSGSDYSIYYVTNFQTTFPNNQWHHFAFTHTGWGGSAGTDVNVNGVANVFVNGKYLAPTGTDTRGFWRNKLIDHVDDNLSFGGGPTGSGTNIGSFKGYIDGIRVSDSIRYSGTSTSEWGNTGYSSGGPTKIYGAYLSQDVGTITITGVAGDGGGDVAFADDHTASSKTQLSTKGLTLTDAGAGNNTATITGTLDGITGTQNSIFAVKATANEDAERTTIVGGTNFLGITQNTPTNPVLFDARRYTGTGAVKDINGLGFQPDLLWGKDRDGTNWHILVDSVRGAHNNNNAVLYSNDTNAVDNPAGGDTFSRFNSDGFSLGTNGRTNGDGVAHIAWGFKAGGAPSAYGKKKIDGVESDIDSNDYNNLHAVDDASHGMKQSINTTGGFSITKFSVGGTSGYGWFKHGFSGDPDWVIIRRIDATYNWDTWHSGLTTSWNTNQTLRLNTNDDLISGRGDIFRDSSTTGFPKGDGKIYIDRGAIYGGDADDEFICYAWKSVSGVSKFGTYSGSGSGGTVTGLGFKPRLVIGKRINGNNNWWMFDRFRESGDALTQVIKPDDPDAEFTSSNWTLTVTNDGFTTGNLHAIGESGGNYIYMAFA